MSAQHTPGPWRCDGDPYVSTVDGRRSVAFTDTCIGGAEDIANARLIAAAPELLHACEQAVEWLEGWASAEPYIRILRAAIAKATGEQA